MALAGLPACSRANGPDAEVVRLDPIPVGPGLTVRFQRDYGRVTITHPESAILELRAGELFLSDGTEEAMVRPLPEGPPNVGSLELYEGLLADLGSAPRVQELLADPEEIRTVLSRFPRMSVPPILERLPAVLDPADPWVRAAALEAWFAEQHELGFLSAEAFVRAGGDPDAKARAAVALLEASPLVFAVRVEPVSEPDLGGRLLWIQYQGMQLAGGVPVPIALALPDMYEEMKAWMEGTKWKEVPDPVTEDDARLFHGALATLIQTNKPGLIDISTGWHVELNAVKP
jgi:hypothetical protein